MQQIADGAGGDDLGGVEDMEGVVFGQEEAVHPRIEPVVNEPGADVIIAKLAFFDFGAVGSQLGEVHVNNIGVGHGGPFL